MGFIPQGRRRFTAKLRRREIFFTHPLPLRLPGLPISSMQMPPPRPRTGAFPTTDAPTLPRRRPDPTVHRRVRPGGCPPSGHVSTIIASHRRVPLPWKSPALPSPHHLSPAPGHHGSVPSHGFAFPRMSYMGVFKYVAYPDWLPLSTTHSSISHVFSRVAASFLFSAG